MFYIFEKYRHDDVEEHFIFLGYGNSNYGSLLMWGLESKYVREFDRDDETLFFGLGKLEENETREIRKFINEHAMDVFKEMESSCRVLMNTLKHEERMIGLYSLVSYKESTRRVDVVSRIIDLHDHLRELQCDDYGNE